MMSSLEYIPYILYSSFQSTDQTTQFPIPTPNLKVCELMSTPSLSEYAMCAHAHTTKKQIKHTDRISSRYVHVHVAQADTYKHHTGFEYYNSRSKDQWRKIIQLHNKYHSFLSTTCCTFTGCEEQIYQQHCTTKLYTWIYSIFTVSATISFITPHTCARGRIISLYVCCCHRRHENHQISRSRHLCML